MAVQFMDGFDHYGVGNNGLANMLSGAWASVAGSASIGVPPYGARTGTASLKSGGGATRRVLKTPAAKVFLSCGFSVEALPSVDFVTGICSFNDGSNVIMAQLWVQSTGVIVLTDKDNNILASTQGPVVVARNWHFLEMEFNHTDQTFILRIDDATGTDTPIINKTGMSTTGNCAQVTVLSSVPFGGQIASWLDDLFVRDGTGSTNNTFLGDRRVATLFANADTPVAGWTPSYFHKFGAGILRLAYREAGNAFVVHPDASINADASSQLDIGSNDFTLETSIRFDQLPTTTTYSTIFSRWNTVGDQRSYRLIYGGPSFNSNCIQFDTSTDGTNSTVATPIVFPWTPDTNVWYDIALCRTAGELLLFIDGAQQGLPIADGTTYFSGGTERFDIGAQNGAGIIPGSGVIGRLDETRFTNGTGRYTGTYTPAASAFPRGISDPHWAQVVLLMGYDTSVADESSFTRAIAVHDGANFITPDDGPSVGQYSTVNKAVPDDGSFIAASYEFAKNVLTMTTQPANTNTITLGTTDGSTPAVYTFKNTLASAFDVKIGATAQITLTNLLNAINVGPGSGTAYGAGTTANFDVTGVSLPAGQIEVIANLAGTGGNSIVSTATGTAAVWDTTTLTGGATIPGPSSFKLQRPPNNTTIISALQMNIRALKTDAGTADIQSSFIGGLGAQTDGDIHALTTSVSYYADIVETDPDTSGPITPTTIINGQLQINRTT